MKKKIDRKVIISIIFLILFLLITCIVFANKTAYIDELVHSYILDIRNNKLTNVMTIITNICSVYSLVAISFILFVIIKNKKTSLYIIINLINSSLISLVFKLLLRRDRPIGINLIEESGYSYPSGHSMVSMAYFGFIAYLIYKKLNKPLSKAILIISIFITIILIGFSRIYLGVHYLSDVIGGFLMAISYLMVYINLINEQNKKTPKKRKK